jgi:hypothetical protein
MYMLFVGGARVEGHMANREQRTLKEFIPILKRTFDIMFSLAPHHSAPAESI